MPIPIRQLIETALGDDDLSDICHDEFPRVYSQFTSGQTKSQKIRLLVEYVDRQQEIPKLLNAIERINPNAYHEFLNTTPQVKLTSSNISTQQQRLEQRRQALQSEWNLRHDKLTRLKQALAIETSPAIKFQLEQQIRDEELQLQQLENQLDK